MNKVGEEEGGGEDHLPKVNWKDGPGTKRNEASELEDMGEHSWDDSFEKGSMEVEEEDEDEDSEEEEETDGSEEMDEVRTRNPAQTPSTLNPQL